MSFEPIELKLRSEEPTRLEKIGHIVGLILFWLFYAAVLLVSGVLFVAVVVMVASRFLPKEVREP
jgi:hypothetical protein